MSNDSTTIAEVKHQCNVCIRNQSNVKSTNGHYNFDLTDETCICGPELSCQDKMCVWGPKRWTNK